MDERASLFRFFQARSSGFIREDSTDPYGWWSSRGQQAGLYSGKLDCFHLLSVFRDEILITSLGYYFKITVFTRKQEWIDKLDYETCSKINPDKMLPDKMLPDKIHPDNIFLDQLYPEEKFFAKKLNTKIFLSEYFQTKYFHQITSGQYISSQNVSTQNISWKKKIPDKILLAGILVVKILLAKISFALVLPIKMPVVKIVVI